MRLIVGVGARPGADLDELDALITSVLPDASAVVAMSTVDARAELLAPLAARRGWPLLTYPAEVLATVQVPTPSSLVAQAVRTPSVAEASALHATTLPPTGSNSVDLAVVVVGKVKGGGGTVAVAARAPFVTVVGVGADGIDGVGSPGRAAIGRAEVLFGSARQLALVPDSSARKLVWPSPLVQRLPWLLAEHFDRRVCVLASGDPMYHGIGTTLVRLLGAGHVHVIPHPSAVSLACARLGWPVEEVEVLSAVGRPLDALRRVLHAGRRILVLSAGSDTPAAVRALLDDGGFAGTGLTVLDSLGGPQERVHADVSAAGPLNIVALHVVAPHVMAPQVGVPGLVPGLADREYRSDGQLTKREIRAVTLARLEPRPGQLLWDVGAGSGSIAIEWLRAHPSCRAIAVERDAVRAETIAANAARLGVPDLPVVRGEAPGALDGLPRPDVVFIGGGVTTAGVLDGCWAALRPGGWLVVNAVTVESERVVADGYARLGGDLTRIAISRSSAVGGFTGWRPMMPVTQWVVQR